MRSGREDAPGYFYVVRKPGDDWEVWMWTGHTWYEPGETEEREPPYWCARVPQAPQPSN